MNKTDDKLMEHEYGPTFSIVIILIIIIISGLYGFNFLRNEVHKNTELRKQIEQEEVTTDNIEFSNDDNVRILGEFESGEFSDEEIEDIINSIINEDKKIQKN